eukprot:jgi/Chlat1/2206/Chrsp17S02767
MGDVGPSSSPEGGSLAGPAAAEARGVFEEAVGACLYRWTALRLAVENQWGGRNSAEKANQLHQDILSWFHTTKGALYADELEDVLDDALVRDFCVEAEDNSPQEVSEQLLQLYDECTKGNFAPALDLKHKAAAAQAASPAVGTSQRVGETDSEESGSEAEEMDVVGERREIVTPAADLAPRLSEQEAADGWEMAPGRRRRGR